MNKMNTKVRDDLYFIARKFQINGIAECIRTADTDKELYLAGKWLLSAIPNRYNTEKDAVDKLNAKVAYL